MNSLLLGPSKWTYFYLYVIIDIFSRRVVGWCVADTESAALFKPLFESAVDRDNPNRFVNKAPQPPQKPTAVWINPPAQKLQVQA